MAERPAYAPCGDLLRANKSLLAGSAQLLSVSLQKQNAREKEGRKGGGKVRVRETERKEKKRKERKGKERKGKEKKGKVGGPGKEGQVAQEKKGRW